MSEKVYTVVYMAVIAAVFTGVVSAVNLMSRERVLLNQKLARQRVVMKVLGIQAPKDATLQQLADTYEKQVKDSGMSYEQEGQEQPILAGYDRDGELLGYAFEIGGQGFWDVIHGYLAVSTDHKKILGIAFYQQSETPGLGAEITKEWFEQQFHDKELPPQIATGKEKIGLAVPGTEKGDYDVDAVTGATQTSKRVEQFLNEDLRAALKVLQEGK
jgi:Na+-transporting NADH:ubiquinone oxidoreductase subunit C